MNFSAAAVPVSADPASTAATARSRLSEWIKSGRLLSALVLHALTLLWALVCLTSHVELGTWLALGALAGSCAALMGAALFREPLGRLVRAGLALIAVLGVFATGYTWLESSTLFGEHGQRLQVRSAGWPAVLPYVNATRLWTMLSLVTGGCLTAGIAGSLLVRRARLRAISGSRLRTGALIAIAAVLMVLMQYRRAGGMHQTFLFASTPGIELGSLAVLILTGFWLALFVPRSGGLAFGLSATGLLGLCLLLWSVPRLFFDDTPSNLLDWLKLLTPAGFSTLFLVVGILLRVPEARPQTAIAVRPAVASFAVMLMLVATGWSVQRTWDLGVIVNGQDPAIARTLAGARRNGILLQIWGGSAEVSIPRPIAPDAIRRVWEEVRTVLVGSTLSIGGVDVSHDLSFVRPGPSADQGGLQLVRIMSGTINRQQLDDLLEVGDLQIWGITPLISPGESPVRLRNRVILGGDLKDSLAIVSMIDVRNSTGTLQLHFHVRPGSRDLDLQLKALGRLLEEVSAPECELKVVLNAGLGQLPALELTRLLVRCNDASRIEIDARGLPASSDRATIRFVIAQGGKAAIERSELQIVSDARFAQWLRTILAAPGRAAFSRDSGADWPMPANRQKGWEWLESMHCLPNPEDETDGLVTVLAPTPLWLELLNANELGRIERLVAGPGMLLGEESWMPSVPSGFLPSLTSLKELYCDVLDGTTALELAKVPSLSLLRLGKDIEPRARPALANAIAGMAGLETLILEQLPDPGLVPGLARLPKFRRLVVVAEEAPANGEVAQLQASLPGVSIEVLTPAEAHELEPAVLKKHRAQMRREILEWLETVDTGAENPAVRPVDD